MMRASLNEPLPTRSVVVSEKIQAAHHERLAVVYIRQSTLQQVVEHHESTRLQYALVTRAQEFGWSRDRIVVIDDDLGKSGATTAGRSGFQRLVADVSLNHVGLILGIEISRLARSCKDWYHLLEVCALFSTLIADSDGIYDPAHYNDRLLLGLKGTMSEAELHVIKQRMDQGKLNKARRGELSMAVPSGYLRRPSGEVILDPDAQVQSVVRLIFRTFNELGTLNAVLRYLVQHDIQLGIRARTGLTKGDLEWHRPNRVTLRDMLHNPIYAGGYAYGRRQMDRRKHQPGRPRTGLVMVARPAWKVLIKDQYPAYISWAEYEANIAQLQANRSRSDAVGSPRVGAALLSGLVVCGRCGRRMTTQYDGAGRTHYSYTCAGGRAEYGSAICQSLAGPPLDAWVSTWLLAALAPAGLEVSLAAAQQLEADRAAVEEIWQQKRERAAYAVARAERQYQLAEPENRLVVRALEGAWEQALAAQQELTEAHARFLQEHPRRLSAAEQAAIRQIAMDVPGLWDAATTTMVERKTIVRQVVERVVVTVQGTTERVQAVIAWAGGSQTEAVIIRPVRRWEDLSYYPDLCARVRALQRAGLGPSAIASQLNAEGYCPPKRHAQVGRQAVVGLLERLGLRAPLPRAGRPTPVEPDTWVVRTLAQRIGMPEITLQHWIGRGWVRAHQEAEPPHRWVIWADAPELERLCALRAVPAGGHTRRIWVEEDVDLRYPPPTPPHGESGEGSPPPPMEHT